MMRWRVPPGTGVWGKLDHFQDRRRTQIAERRMLIAELLRDHIWLDEISLPELEDLAAYIDVLVYTDWVASPTAAYFGAAYAEVKGEQK